MKVSMQRGYLAVISPGFTKWVGWIGSGRFDAAATAPFPGVITFRDEDDMIPWIINHEKIHFHQQRDVAYLPALLLYLLEYLWALLLLRKPPEEAYLWCSAEQEAYRNDHDFDYLARRRPFAQLWYLIHKRDIAFNSSGKIIYRDE